MDFPSGQALLREVEDHTRKIWMRELRTALGVYQDPAAYVNRIQQYADHVEALRNGRLVTDVYRVDGDSKPNPVILEQFEKVIHGDKKMSNAEQTTYRALFSARSFDWDPKQSPSENIQTLYQAELERLRKADEHINQKILTEFREHLKNGIKPNRTNQNLFLNAQSDRFERALKQLNETGYPIESLPKMMDWALQNQYISDSIKAK